MKKSLETYLMILVYIYVTRQKQHIIEIFWFEQYW